MKLIVLAAVCVAVQAGASAKCQGNTIQKVAPKCTNSAWQLTSDNEGCVEKHCPNLNEKEVLAYWATNADWRLGHWNEQDHGRQRCYPAKYGSHRNYLFGNQGWIGQASCDWWSDFRSVENSVTHHGISGIDVRVNFGEWRHKDGNDKLRVSVRMCTKAASTLQGNSNCRRGHGCSGCGSWQRAHQVTGNPRGIQDRIYHWSVDRPGDKVQGADYNMVMSSGHMEPWMPYTSQKTYSDSPGSHANLDNSHMSFQIHVHTEADDFNSWYAVQSVGAYVYDCLESGRATTDNSARANGGYVAPTCGCNKGYRLQGGSCVPDTKAPTAAPTKNPTMSPTRTHTSTLKFKSSSGASCSMAFDGSQLHTDCGAIKQGNGKGPRVTFKSGGQSCSMSYDGSNLKTNCKLGSGFQGKQPQLAAADKKLTFEDSYGASCSLAFNGVLDTDCALGHGF
jgi:hypothetical protein